MCLKQICIFLQSFKILRSINDFSYQRMKKISIKLKGYFCFPTLGPGPRPQFVFDGPGPNLYLTAPALICI